MIIEGVNQPCFAKRNGLPCCWQAVRAAGFIRWPKTLQNRQFRSAENIGSLIFRCPTASTRGSTLWACWPSISRWSWMSISATASRGISTAATAACLSCRPTRKAPAPTGTPAPQMRSIRISTLSSGMIQNMSWSCRVTISTRWTTKRCLISTRKRKRTAPSRSFRFRWRRRPGLASWIHIRTAPSTSLRRSRPSPRATSPQWVFISSPGRRCANIWSTTRATRTRPRILVKTSCRPCWRMGRRW